MKIQSFTNPQTLRQKGRLGQILAKLILCVVCLLAIASGCATRTSPQTVNLKTIRMKGLVPIQSPTETNSVYSVAVRFPSGFQDETAKRVFVEKVQEMVTIRDKKGQPSTKPYQQISFNFDPDEAILKSLHSALQLRQCVASNSLIKVFLIPCSLAISNSDLILVPPPEIPICHATVDVSIINPLASMPDAPAYKWQGCNMSYLFAPMVQISLSSAHDELPVAGTHRWLTKDGKLAIVLPDVLERRYRKISGSTWGTLARNYPILTAKNPAFIPVATTVPPNRGSYYEFDSFVVGSKADADFTPYWNGVAAVLTDVLAATPKSELDLLPKYSIRLGLGEIPVSNAISANRFLEAEWRFMQMADEAVIKKLEESHWFTGMDELKKSEDKYLSKAKSKYFWNQFAQITFALAGAAAAGANSALAAQNGTSYNPNTALMMNMSISQGLGAAGSADQAKAYDIYKAMTGDMQSGVSEVMLGLGEESSGITFKTIGQIREYARKKLTAY
jgi:hypothetical protein